MEKIENILEIKRFEHDANKASRGAQFLNNKFIGFSIERPNLFNQPFISRIPADTYIAHKVSSKKRGFFWLLENKNGRTEIIINHSGSYAEDFEGCTGLGNKLWINKKTGQRMILNTRKMCREFISTTKDFDIMKVIIT